jgi:alpha-tubulin suppressor-like RCC1 family protein
MKTILRSACGATGLVLCSLAIHGCNDSEGPKNGGTCSQLNGTWAGHEVDLSGGDRGPVTFVVQNDQIQGSISDNGMDPESYTLAVACNERATPHQISGTVRASNQPEAVGQPFYGIYEMDPVARSGRLSGFQPGSTTFPTTFAAASGQRLFVFESALPCSDPNAVKAKAITSGSRHTCALMTNGGVRCWGDNSFGELGNGSNGNSLNASGGDVLTEVQAVEAGGDYTCALMTTGGVRCWGMNATGQLGDGTNTGRNTPPSTDALTGVQAIAVTHECMVPEGGTTCALTTSSGVRCWGDSYEGKLGDGTASNYGSFQSTPPSTDVLTGVQAIDVDEFSTCALTVAGGVRCWGRGVSTPPVTDLLTGVQAIAMGVSHTCALMTTGGVRCWGDNSYGQLGNGTTTGSSGPPNTDVLAGVRAIATGGQHTCALMTTGGVRCWGYNHDGELGDGSTTNVLAPPSTDVLTGAQAITAGYSDTCALMTAGNVQCWGYNYSGQLGISTGAGLTPAPVKGFCQ